MAKKPSGFIIKILIAVVIVAAIGTPFVLHAMHENHFPAALRGFAIDPKPITEVSLTDKDGQTIHDHYFSGKWTLVFFGYTNCPDVCPSTLMQMKELYKSIASLPDHNDYQFLFISVDPARDDTRRLKSYVEYFDKHFNAASGKMDQIKSFEKVFGAFHHYDKKSRDDMHYAVAHSAQVYIVDPQERFVGKFLPPINVDKLTVKLSKLNRYLTNEDKKA